MARLLQAIRDDADPMTLLTRVVDQALAMTTAADGAAVHVVVAPDHLTCLCAGGTLERAVGSRVVTSGSLAGLALRTRQTLTSPDVATDARADRSLADRFGIGSVACVPLWRGPEPIGVLSVSASSTHAFGDEAIDDLQRVAEFTSAVIAAAADLAASPTRCSTRNRSTRTTSPRRRSWPTCCGRRW